MKILQLCNTFGCWITEWDKQIREPLAAAAATIWAHSSPQAHPDTPRVLGENFPTFPLSLRGNLLKYALPSIPVSMAQL